MSTQAQQVAGPRHGIAGAHAALVAGMKKVVQVGKGDLRQVAGALNGPRAMQQEAQAMEREAVARGNPETAVGLAWEREAAGTDEQTDKVALTFRMSLPIYRSAYGGAADAAPRLVDHPCMCCLSGAHPALRPNGLPTRKMRPT